MTERRVTFIDYFERDLKALRKRYRRIEQDVRQFVNVLKSGGTPGDRIQGTGDYEVYKVRVASSDMQRGKSGGFRIIYYLRTETRILLLSIYAKTEQENIPTSEVLDLIDMAEQEQDESGSDDPDSELPPAK